jgi:hypothetical protein
MKGNPLWELAWVVLLFALLLPPMLHVTRSRDRQPAPIPMTTPPTTARPAIKVPTWLTLRFAHPPQTFSVHQGEIELWKGAADSPTTTVFEEEIVLPVTQGLELRVMVTWPENTPSTIAELTLEPDGFRAVSRSAWSGGHPLNAVFEFLWSEP